VFAVLVAGSCTSFGLGEELGVCILDSHSASLACNVGSGVWSAGNYRSWLVIHVKVVNVNGVVKRVYVYLI
jgi:hypothetical protein